MVENKNVVKVSDLAYQLLDVTNQIALLENYFSCISLQNVQKQQDCALVSLFHERGLDNSMEVLRVLKEKTQDVADLLCECECEVSTDDK